MTNKGQFFSSEVLMAYFIFSLAIIMVFFLWNVAVKEINQSEEMYNLEEKAVSLGEKLVKTEGVPKNWTKKNVMSVGLAKEKQPRVLDKTKIIEFIQLMNESYEERSHLLGLGKYDFFFNLTDMQGGQIIIENLTCATGKKPSQEKSKLPVERTALWNDSIVKVKLIVWEELI